MTYYDSDGVSMFLDELTGTSESKHRVNQHIMPRSAVVYSDYNYRKWKHISLFGGIGLGCAQVVNQVEDDEPEYWYRDTWRENFFVFSPRVGVEFFNHIRLTVNYKALSKYSRWGVNLGFAFGGGAKK